MLNNPKLPRRSAGLFFGLLLFAGIIYFLSGANSFAAIGRIRARHLIFITAITFAINGVSALRWKFFLAKLGIAEIRWGLLLQNITLAKLSGHTFSETFGDIAVRIHGLHREKVGVRGVLFSVAVEKVFEALLLLSILIGWFVNMAATTAGQINSNYHGLIFIFVAMMLLSQLPFRVASWWVSRKNGKQKLSQQFSSSFLPGVQAAALSLVKYVLVTFRYAAIFGMLRIDVKPIEVFYGTSFAHLGLIGSITPGGIGLVEAGWTGYLAYLKMPPDAIGQFLLAQRVVVIICIAISTGVVFAFPKIQQVLPKRLE